jgi:hypothetical protein
MYRRLPSVSSRRDDYERVIDEERCDMQLTVFREWLNIASEKRIPR